MHFSLERTNCDKQEMVGPCYETTAKDSHSPEYITIVAGDSLFFQLLTKSNKSYNDTVPCSEKTKRPRVKMSCILNPKKKKNEEYQT